jgi:hypothetical protein
MKEVIGYVVLDLRSVQTKQVGTYVHENDVEDIKTLLKWHSSVHEKLFDPQAIQTS